MQQEEFLSKVQNYAELADTDQALRMTKVVLATLGEWLYRTEASKLAAQLPKEFQDFLFEKQKPEQRRTEVVYAPPEEFYNRVKARADISVREAVKGTKAITRVLQEAVSPGEMEDVLQQLPDEFNELFT